MSRPIQFHRDSCSFPNEAKTLMKGFNKDAPLAQGVHISDLDVRSQPFVSQIKAVIYIRYGAFVARALDESCNAAEFECCLVQVKESY